MHEIWYLLIIWLLFRQAILSACLLLLHFCNGTLCWYPIHPVTNNFEEKYETHWTYCVVSLLYTSIWKMDASVHNIVTYFTHKRSLFRSRVRWHLTNEIFQESVCMLVEVLLDEDEIMYYICWPKSTYISLYTTLDWCCEYMRGSQIGTTKSSLLLTKWYLTSTFDD